MPKFNNNNRKTIRNRNRMSKPSDPIFTATRIILSGARVPSHNIAPTVTRTVRILATLTSGSPTYAITPNVVALQDAKDYTGGTTLRYSSLRFHIVKGYAESPNSLSVSQSPYGLVITDANTGFAVADRPITGSHVAAVGYKMPFQIRQDLYATSNTTTVTTISCDQTIAATTNYVVTLDITVDFYG